MGMVTVLRRLDDDTITKLLRHPKLIHKVLAEEELDDEAVEVPGFFARLLGKTDAALPLISLEREAGDEVDLDKAWNAIHFMLTGAAEDTLHPLGFIYCGGNTVGNEEVGYGPARAFSSGATRAIAGLVGSISREVFLSRFNAPALLQAKVYPEPLWEPERVGERNELYVADNFDSLREFLLSSAEAKKGFVIFAT